MSPADRRTLGPARRCTPESLLTLRCPFRPSAFYTVPSPTARPDRNPHSQPFALVKDLHSLATRLAQVEAFLQTLPPELRTGAPQPQVFAATYGQAMATAPKQVLPPPVESGRQMGGVMVKDEVAGNDVVSRGDVPCLL